MKNKRLLSIALTASMFLGTALSSITAVADNTGIFDKPLAPIQKKEFTGKKFVAKPLVILMDFPDYKHEELDTRESAFRINSFKGSETTKEFYQKLFFGKETYTTSDGKEHMTVRKFFEQESGGIYDFDGTVTGWYMAKENAAFYGKAKTDQAQCRDFLVKEAIAAAAKELDLSQFDVEDKWDLDGDGNFDEPDGIIDSIVVIHPGIGEEWKGGSLGEDAIWPFRWGYKMFGEDDEAMTPEQRQAIIAQNPTVTDKSGKTFSLEDFTVFEQDLPVDLFCHEFGHVLGLPDLYDSGDWSDIPVENWSIMGGSYTGDPRGSQPVSYGAYCRQFLQKDFMKRKRTDANWQNAKELTLDSIPKEGIDIILDQASLKGKNKDTVRIDLPTKKDKLEAQPMPEKHGTKFFFSDAGDEIENYMTTKTPIDLTKADAPKLSINAWYDIDPGYDFASVQVKVEGTDKWIAIKDENGLATDKIDPSLLDGKWKETPEQLLHRNPGWGFTDVIKGNDWTDITFDLSAYKGKKIDLRFRFATDTNTPQFGIYLDNVKVSDGTNVIFADDAEGEEKFNFNGFYVTDGYAKDQSDHYYLLEWRNKDNGLIDKGLGCVNIGNPGLEYDSGLIVWYINEKYNGFKPNQNVKVHPGEAFAMVIDADQDHIRYRYKDGRAGADRINYQMHDAAFSLRKDSPLVINGGSGTGAYTVSDEHLFMNPNFSDGYDYSDDRGTYKAGVVLREYGLQVLVTEESKDSSTAKIHIAKKQDKPTEQKQNEIKEVKIKGGKIEVTTTKEFAEDAYIVVKDKTQREEIELIFMGGKYIAKTKLGDDAVVEFIILEDAAGNAKAIYNGAVNGVYGVDFANLVLTQEPGENPGKEPGENPGEKPVDKVDKTVLTQTIKKSDSLVKNLKVSLDKKGMTNGTNFWLQKDYDAFQSALNSAKAVLANEKATKEDVTKANADLAAAAKSFEAAKQASTPATSDTTNAGLFGILLVISMLGCVVVVKKSKKTNAA